MELFGVQGLSNTLGGHRQVEESGSSGIEDGIGDGGPHTDDGRLAAALGSELVVGDQHGFERLRLAVQSEPDSLCQVLLLRDFEVSRRFEFAMIGLLSSAILSRCNNARPPRTDSSMHEEVGRVDEEYV